MKTERNFNRFANRIGLSDEEARERKKLLDESFMPFQVTEHYTRLIELQQEPYKSQLLNIVLPPVGDKPFTGRFDPYGNTRVRQEEHYLQHKYPQTLLFHTDDFCFGNCQFCYKVAEIRHEEKNRESYQDKTTKAVRYLKEHPEVDNVLLTGGDPAIRKTSQLIEIIEQLLEPDNIRVVRFATKGLAFEPQRFQDPELLDFFRDINGRDGKRIIIISQYNHPSEIDEHSQESLRKLQECGVQVYGQPAIIRGVNDSVEVLTDLQNRFLENNIQSYYLIAFMPVKGVEQYGFSLDEIFRRVAESKQRLNGLAKKGVLIAPHNWGKLEIAGFLPSGDEPERIVLRWHEIAMPQYLPQEFKGYRAEDLLELKFKKGSLYCLDHVLEHNGLPYQ
jgi:KamA family protein